MNITAMTPVQMVHAGKSLAAGLTGLPLSVVLITAAMPTGANAFLLARQADVFVEAAASTIVVTTLLSLATLSALLVWLH